MLRHTNISCLVRERATDVTAPLYYRTVLTETNAISTQFNPLNANLNPIYPLLALFGDHHILHVSR